MLCRNTTLLWRATGNAGTWERKRKRERKREGIPKTQKYTRRGQLINGARRRSVFVYANGD